MEPGWDFTVALAANDLPTSENALRDAVVPTYEIEVEGQPVAAGVTPGVLDVNARGAATYRIPLWVPPGLAGLQPDLALSYDSTSGDGPLGLGWTLSGATSPIQRCGKNMADDGYFDGLHFDNRDNFCFQGQRLVAVRGEYGADQTEYRTEHDQITKLVSHGAPEPRSWTAWTKDGRTLSFGARDNSRLRGGRYTPISLDDQHWEVRLERDDTDVNLAWLLDSVSDRAGNSMSTEAWHSSGIRAEWRAD